MKKLELFKEKPWILFFLSMLTACSPLKEKNSSNIIIPHSGLKMKSPREFRALKLAS